jgi:hypothetical protein
MKSLRRTWAAEKGWRTRRARKAFLEAVEARSLAARRPLAPQDCCFFEFDPDEPCWGKTTCWEHSAADHPGCTLKLCHGHRDCHLGNDFTGGYEPERARA